MATYELSVTNRVSVCLEESCGNPSTPYTHADNDYVDLSNVVESCMRNNVQYLPDRWRDAF